MYNTLLLYGMYALLVVLSAIGGYLKIYTADVAQYVLLFVIGHFAGVMTPSPVTEKEKI